MVLLVFLGALAILDSSLRFPPEILKNGNNLCNMHLLGVQFTQTLTALESFALHHILFCLPCLFCLRAYTIVVLLACHIFIIHLLVCHTPLPTSLPSISSTSPVITIYIYIDAGMHIYCNAVSYKCSYNFVHLQCILYTVSNDYYVLINLSGSSAANSNVHNYSLLIFCSSSSGTNLHFRSIHRSHVPLNFLGWDFMPISFFGGQDITHPHNCTWVYPMYNGSMG